MAPISAPAGKSPSGLTPITNSVFRLMMRPRICGGTRVCINVTAVAPAAFCAAPRTSSAATDSHTTAENTAAVPASRWSPVPPVQSCLLLPAPSCNRISGEDLRQRVDHLVPPSGLVLRARTLPLEARLFGLHYIDRKSVVEGKRGE